MPPICQGTPTEQGYGSIPRGEIEQAVAAVAADDDWLTEHPPAWSWYTDYPPSEIDPDSPIVAVAQEAGRDLGVEVQAEGIDTTYDGALLTLFAETPSPAFGPGDLARAHAPDEWVGIDELVLGAKVYARAISLWCGVVEVSEPVFVREPETSVFLRELDRPYPLIERAEGVWLYDPAGNAYLDAVGGGAMVTSVGHGVPELVEAAREQASRVSFLYNQQFTTTPQEELARELLALAPEGFTRVHFVTGGAEANETAVRLARSYHVERGEPERWRIVSPAQAYHGPTVATLSLTGRPGLHHHYAPYLTPTCISRPRRGASTRAGRQRSRRSTACLDEAGPQTVSAFFCEPVSAAALPGYSPPERFWQGLAERRDEHGFLICLDEVVTGHGPNGHVVRRRAAPVRAGRDHDRQGARAPATRRLAPCSAATRSTARSPKARVPSSWGTHGTERRCPAPSGSPSSTTSGSDGSSSGYGTRARGS